MVWWLLRVVAVVTLVAMSKGLIYSCGEVSNIVLSRRLLSCYSWVTLYLKWVVKSLLVVEVSSLIALDRGFLQ